MKSISKSYRPKQAAEFLGIGVATFWRWASERSDFPKMIRLSARCTVIDGDELIAWRDAQRTNASIPAPSKQPDKTPRVDKNARILAALKAEDVRIAKQADETAANL